MGAQEEMARLYVKQNSMKYTFIRELQNTV